MLEHLANPTNPCEGCRHRTHEPPVFDRRTGTDRPTTGCQKRGGTLYRVFYGDPLPTWCPGKEGR